MSDEPTPAVERTPAPEYKPSEKYNELAAAMNKIAEAADDLGTKAEKIADVQKEMAEERNKLRQVNAPDYDGAMSFKTLMSRPNARKDSDIAYMHELNDRAIDRAVVKMCKGRAVPAQADVKLSDIPKEVWDSIPEVQELRGLAKKDAGTWWDSTTSTSVSQWVPTQILSTAIDFYTLDADLPMLFDNITIPRGVGSVSVPVETSQSYAYLEAQTTALATADGEFMPATGLVRNPIVNVATLTPNKIANGTAVTMEAVEDSAVDLLARARTTSARAVMHGVNQAIINGQGNDDADLDDADSTSGYYAANNFSNDAGDNGLRLHCIINSFTTAIGGTVGATDILAARKSCGKFGAMPDDLAYVTSPQGYLGMLSDTNVLTVDKYGAGATVLTGELARVGGVRIFMDSEFSEDLDAAGINANAATTGITGGVLFNRRRWLFGTGRTLDQTLVPQPGYDAMYVISRTRVDFVIAVTDEHNAHYLINVS